MEQKKQRLPIKELEESAEKIRFMGHPQRLRILEFLDINGLQSVSEIMKAVNGQQVIVSQSLKKLKQDDLVQCMRKGRYVLYELATDSPKRLFECMRRNYALRNGQPVPTEKDVKRPLPEDFITSVAEKINFIGHPLRLRILEFLDTHEKSCVCEIMEEMDISQTTASQSLKKLKQAGLVDGIRDGRFVLYHISADLPKTLLECMRRRYFEKPL